MRTRTSLVVIGLAAALVLALAPGALAQAQEPGFGSIVGDLGDDAEHVIDAGGPDSFRFSDSDDDGSLDSGEAVYLTDGSTSDVDDVRLANPLDGSPFTMIRSGDDDVDLELDSLSGTLRFFDADRSGRFSPGDTVYYDLSGSGEADVSVNDVVLAGTQAGTLVRSGYEEFGFATQDFEQTPSYGFYDEDDDGNLDTDEGVVVDADDDDLVTIGDIRLSGTAGGDGGTIVEAGDNDVTYVLDRFDGSWGFVHRDPDGGGDFNNDEPVYISSGEDVDTFAVRIANAPSGSDEGSQVVESHDDWGIDTNDLSGSLKYVDEDNDDGFTDEDTLYYDLSDGTSGEVDSGDIVLSGGGAGEVAGGGSGGLGDDLTSYSGNLRYFDANGNDVYDGGDIVYADTDNDDIVRSYDVQLSDGEDPYGGSDDGDDSTTDRDGDGVVDGDDNCEDTANPDQVDTDDDGSGDGCDTDDDGDEVLDDQDNCPLVANAQQHDTDDDGEGDACDADSDVDGDGLEDRDDNCPRTGNPSQGDQDGDGTGDACDQDRDTDGDGTPDGEDNCPSTANPEQTDVDRDTTGNACDEDRDGDGVPNDEDAFPEDPEASADRDGDGISDTADNCNTIANPEQTDVDDDSSGDGCDGDVDGDGVTNVAERRQGTNGSSADSDADGARDGEDNCPTTSNPGQADADGDGTGDRCDETPGTGTGVPGPGVVAVLLALTVAFALRRSGGP